MDGKVVVITGASRGIGAAAAQVFAAAGAKVALLARSSAEIDALAAEIGPQAMALTVDVGDWEAMAAAIASVEAAFGPVDVLINNAGVIAPISGLAESTPSAWMEAITINSCKIIGIEQRFGSIELGKSATIFVSKGPALDMKTNQVTTVLLNGKIQTSVNFQEALYLKYKAKYKSNTTD